MFGAFGWMELLLIVIIVLIVFGAGKLPQLGEGIGKAIKSFKTSMREAEEELAQHKSESSTSVGEIAPHASESSQRETVPPEVRALVGEGKGQEPLAKGNG